MADMIGAFTGSPEITLLCVANLASIIVDFFYQITLFTAVLAVVGIEEEKRRINKGRKIFEIYNF